MQDNIQMMKPNDGAMKLKLRCLASKGVVHYYWMLEVESVPVSLTSDLLVRFAAINIDLAATSVLATPPSACEGI